MEKKYFGETLKLARETRGLSGRQAAATFGVSESSWWYWEAGKTRPHGRLIRPVMLAWPEIGEWRK